jgi:alkylated DNA repair dioxygenase AlkB
MEQYLTYYPLNVEKSSYLYIGHLPEELRPDQATFDLMWSLQPEEDQYVMRGTKKAPRKFQNYVHSYKFSGSVHLPAAVTPPIFQYYLDWANSFGGFTYNGILLNWYPDANSHVSWHPDSESDIWTDAAGNTEILSLSFGATRRFDLRDNITSTASSNHRQKLMPMSVLVLTSHYDDS